MTFLVFNISLTLPHYILITVTFVSKKIFVPLCLCVSNPHTKYSHSGIKKLYISYKNVARKLSV